MKKTEEAIDYRLTVALTERQYTYVRENIDNFSAWVRDKIDEEMQARKRNTSILKKLVGVLSANIVIKREGKYLVVLLETEDGDIDLHREEVESLDGYQT